MYAAKLFVVLHSSLEGHQNRSCGLEGNRYSWSSFVEMTQAMEGLEEWYILRCSWWSYAVMLTLFNCISSRLASHLICWCGCPIGKIIVAIFTTHVQLYIPFAKQGAVRPNNVGQLLLAHGHQSGELATGPTTSSLNSQTRVTQTLTRVGGSSIPLIGPSQWCLESVREFYESFLQN